jgi:hypothetical protein
MSSKSLACTTKTKRHLPMLATPWLKADVFFLKDATSHGMSCEEIAGFVGHPEEEVRRKASSLKFHRQ